MDLGQPHYMPPSEVHEVMRRLWRNDGAILAHLFSVETARIPQSKHLPWDPEQAFEMFFLKAVAVAPNRCVAMFQKELVLLLPAWR